jgi:hypothetical protein
VPGLWVIPSCLLLRLTCKVCLHSLVWDDTWSTLTSGLILHLPHQKYCCIVCHNTTDYCVKAQELVRFPAEAADRLQTWLKNSRWQLRTVGKGIDRLVPSVSLTLLIASIADDRLYVGSVDYQLFDRISDYDSKREHGIFARRKHKNTTEWLCANKILRSWLEDDDSMSHLWISSKGRQAIDKLRALNMLGFIRQPRFRYRSSWLRCGSTRKYLLFFCLGKTPLFKV